MEVSSMGICHGEPSSSLPAMSMVKGEQHQTSLASLHWLLSSNSCLGGSRSSSCSFQRKFSVSRRLQAAAGYFPVWNGVVIPCENLPIVVQGNQSQGRSPRAIQWGIQTGTLLDFQTHRRARIGGYKPHALPTTPATQPASAQEMLEQWRLEKELQSLKDLNKQLQEASNLEERITVIDRSNKHVHSMFGRFSYSGSFVNPVIALARQVLEKSDLYLLKCMVASGQEHVLDAPSDMLSTLVGARADKVKDDAKFELSSNDCSLASPATKKMDQEEVMQNGHVSNAGTIESITQSLQSLVRMLERMDRFYDSIGGIIG